MKPYYEDALTKIYHGDSRDVLSRMDPADAVVTDPPYGVGKAEWDDELPLWWLQDAAALSPVLALMPGTRFMLRCPYEAGRLRYRWTLVAHISNGMTRGAFGFQNWFPILIYAADGISLYRDAQDAKTFAIAGEMPEHPSPKPLASMTWLLSMLPARSVIDPFMGSGTTLVAAKALGLRAIGIEIDERYCDIAANRLRQETLGLSA